MTPFPPYSANARIASFGTCALLLLAITSLAYTSNASAAAETWSRTYDGGGATNIVPTSDGGHLAGGHPYLLKLDSQGDIKWGKNLQLWNPGVVMETEDGGYLVIARAEREDTLTLILVKFDSEGEIVWLKDVPPMGFLEAMYQVDDGGYILSGSAYPDWPFGEKDVWVVKLDSDGNVEWDKIYGGVKADISRGIAQTADGGYIVSAHTTSFGSGSCEIWVLKLNSTGGVEWQKAYGDEGCNGVTSVVQMSDGGYVFGGSIEPVGEATQAWLLKLQSNGEIEWQKEYASEDGFINSIRKTSDDALLLAGELDGSPWAAKVDTDGNIVWQKSYPGFALYSIAESSDGGVVAVGEQNSFESHQLFWVFKADSEGNLDNCIRDIVEETSVSVTDTAVNVVDTDATVGDLSATFEDLNIELTDVAPQFSSQCGPNPDSTLSLFESDGERSDGLIFRGQTIRAVAETTDSSVEEITFRWTSPSGNQAREITAPISSPEDTFAPKDDDGTWTVEVDFGNGKVLQKSFNLSFFVIPESPIGPVAMILASIAALAGYMYHKARKSNLGLNQ